MGWKIVRDNDEQVCRQMGISGQWREATPDRVIPGLARKLLEEAGEFMEHGDAGEVYDLRDVVGELVRLVDPDGEALSRHAEKVDRRGQFHRHIEWTPVPGCRYGHPGCSGNDDECWAMFNGFEEAQW